MKLAMRVSAAVVLLCAWAGSVHANVPEAPASCVWFADKDAIHQVASGDNKVARSIALGKAHSLAMSGSGCGVWAISTGQLHQFDADGVQTRQIALRSLNDKLGDTTQAMADPYDGSVWLSDNKTLVHADANGQIIATATAPGNIAQIKGAS